MYIFIGIFLVLIQIVFAISDVQHHSGQNHHNFPAPTENLYAARSTSIKGSIGLSVAREIVSNAIKAMAVANKLRIDNPQFNKYEFREHNSIQHKPPPLDYGNATISKIKNTLHRRSEFGNGTSFRNSTDYSYSIPAELAEAARLVAESDPPTAPASSLAIFPTSETSNDTNAMDQMLLRPDGLYGWVPDNVPSIFSSITKKVEIRARSTFWMANMQQNGVSPFAPAGYKVWRNVLDYGAKGDGTTDDTAAIRLAVTSGNRCGANCGSATIVPAVVYFPPGTYLVSSEIIQYYNTQFLGDPSSPPTILAASSFIGLGVFTADFYTGETPTSEWYLNTNNFLRSIRNFNIDIRAASLFGYVYCIHWQVAQATSLENIVFWMSTVVGSVNTQQGIYMENGSGGFLADLTFNGGSFGAYMGNQQFTSRNLVFNGCHTALQIHWDWAWTMQGISINNCGVGILIIGGAGGPGSTGQSVGSLVLADLWITDTPLAISTSLLHENSTSLLIQNALLTRVTTAVYDNVLSRTILAGGTSVSIESWGFGLISNSSGTGSFLNGADIPILQRVPLLTTTYTTQGKLPQPAFFTRRRPKYTDIGLTQILDVTQLGAKGDGLSDNTAALNAILAVAANISSVVFFPFGVYKITDTIFVPVGSRITGQAWSQIMAAGTKFQDVNHPRVSVQIGKPGDVGVIEIQDMMFTVSGPTAGAVLVELNVHESTQGSVDTHIRVGGATGSNLQKANCPKSTGNVNMNCAAASLMFHMTAASSAYLENVWLWSADHDMDVVTQDQIDIYSARGLLIESQGPNWLYGTSVEHNTLYQYQLSGANNTLMGLIQTESPYFQASPAAPAPFPIGLFANDPTFSNCRTGMSSCAMSWAVRIVDSSNIYVLSAGLYSWFQKYQQQPCLDSGNCQDRAFETEERYNIWIYNLVTKGVVEMISPNNGTPTYARNNVNGFMSSILAWLGGANQKTGARTFTGFQAYHNDDWLADLRLPPICSTALTAVIKCNNYVAQWTEPRYRGPVGNISLTDSICDVGCGASLASYFNTVVQSCSGYTINGFPATIPGGYMWQGYNETCLKDKTTGKYCNEIISQFSDSLSTAEMCSSCYLSRLKIMQGSQYSSYSDYTKSQLTSVYTSCGSPGLTDIPPPLYVVQNKTSFCASNALYTTQSGDNCDSIAVSHNISSASLFLGNTAAIGNCTSMIEGSKLCLPFQCRTYSLLSTDTCQSIESKFNLRPGTLRMLNPWIVFGCFNIQISTTYYGKTICLSPEGGTFNSTGSDPTIISRPRHATGYTLSATNPPSNATLATGTTENCGLWYLAAASDTCSDICIKHSITISLFLAANPSLSQSSCSTSLIAGLTYCIGPVEGWNDTVTTPTKTSSSILMTSTT